MKRHVPSITRFFKHMDSNPSLTAAEAVSAHGLQLLLATPSAAAIGVHDLCSSRQSLKQRHAERRSTCR